MRKLILALTLGLGSPALAQDAGQAALAGTWTAAEAERDGAAADELIGHRLVFDGDAFRISAPDGELLYGGTYQADPAAQPPRIDFRNDAGQAAGQEWEGIYRLEGDTLTIVDDAPDPAKGRPTAFAAPAGSGYVLLVFRR
jgi:uncharacterized protein (TIGR03067 family)